MNIQIIKADVIKSAEAMNDIADALKRLDFVGPMHKLGSAMSGGATVGGSQKLASEWRDDQHRWVTEAGHHRDRSVADAKRIEEADVVTAQEGARQQSALDAGARSRLESKLGTIRG